ncbi:Syntaxin-5 [Branchiostoma belcheri]|nr:Syntaxin-5 [Branchiostoma belcheri]
MLPYSRQRYCEWEGCSVSPFTGVANSARVQDHIQTQLKEQKQQLPKQQQKTIELNQHYTVCQTELSLRRRRFDSGGSSNGNGSERTVSSSPTYVVPSVEMSCRDRTSEFVSAVKSMQMRQALATTKIHPYLGVTLTSGLKWGAHELRAFDARLAPMALKVPSSMAKRKSLFDDKPVEIQELTYIIKQDIASLNKQIAELQEFARSRVRQNGRHVQSHSNSVVVALQSKLATMSNDFKSVLEVRTENLKHQRSRREQFSQGPVSSSMPPSTYNAPNGEAGGSILLLDETKSLQSGEVAIDMDALERQRHQRQLQLVEEDDAYIQERARTMENIESTIVELGSIFQQLATMVKEQEEQVQRIDDNVEDTVLNVEAAHGEILKYFQSISSNRWLMIKVFGVLIVFFIIFVVFLA